MSKPRWLCELLEHPHDASPVNPPVKPPVSPPRGDCDNKRTGCKDGGDQGRVVQSGGKAAVLDCRGECNQAGSVSSLAHGRLEDLGLGQGRACGGIELRSEGG